MSLDSIEAQVSVRVFRGGILAATALLLVHMQGHFTFSSWQIALVFGMLGLMHSTERVARIGLTVLLVLALIPPSGLASFAKWTIAVFGLPHGVIS